MESQPNELDSRDASAPLRVCLNFAACGFGGGEVCDLWGFLFCLALATGGAGHRPEKPLLWEVVRNDIWMLFPPRPVQAQSRARSGVQWPRSDHLGKVQPELEMTCLPPKPARCTREAGCSGNPAALVPGFYWGPSQGPRLRLLLLPPWISCVILSRDSHSLGLRGLTGTVY